MPWELAIDVRESEFGTTLRQIINFDEVETSSRYDSVASTFALAFLFDPNNKNHAEIAGVSHYHEANFFYIHENGKKELYLRGYVLSQQFVDSATPQLVRIGGYSKAGLIEDCDIPPKAYPLEYSGLSFAQITRKIISYFGGKKGIKLIIGSKNANSDVKTPEEIKAEKEDYEKSTAPESNNIKSYLTELAKQKNLVLSHTVEGDLLIAQANTNSTPLFEIDLDGGAPGYGIKSMTLNYNGQAIHSHITVIRQADDEGGNYAEATVMNPLCPILYRPKVEIQSSGDDISVQAAAQNKLCEELKNISLTIVMSRAAIDNKLISKNNTITVKNRKIYLYEKTKWFIEAVALKQNKDEEEAILTCVLPWTYNYNAKNIPKAGRPKTGPYNVFIDPHKNLPKV